MNGTTADGLPVIEEQTVSVRRFRLGPWTVLVLREPAALGADHTGQRQALAEALAQVVRLR
jgi:hypothetical protein